MSEQVDFLTSSLSDILLGLREQQMEAEKEARRWDEGVCMLEWAFAKFPAQHSAVITPADVLTMAGDVAVFGSCGRKSAWIEKAQREIGRA